MKKELAPSSHLTTEQLIDYIEERLSSDDAQAVEGHLGTQCDSCHTELDWLNENMGLIAAGMWLEPPKDLSLAVRQMFRERRAANESRLSLDKWLQRLRAQPRPVAIAFAAALVLFIAFGLILRTQSRTRFDQEVSVAAAAGTVLALPPDSQTWQPLSEDDLLNAGTQIRTGEDSSVLLTYPDDSKTVAAPNTELEILQMSSHPSGNRSVILIKQNLGQTLNVVQPSELAESRFEIQTPAATVVVHGTEFSVIVDDDGVTEVKVLEGTVEVGAMGVTVTLNAGQSTTVFPGDQPATPESLGLTPSPTATRRATRTPRVESNAEEDNISPTPAPFSSRRPTSTPTDVPTRRATPTAPLPTATAPLPSTATSTPTATKTPLSPTATNTPPPPTVSNITTSTPTPVVIPTSETP